MILIVYLHLLATALPILYIRQVFYLQYEESGKGNEENDLGRPPTRANDYSLLF